MNMHEEFGRHNEELLKFERVDAPLSQRPDLCAFLMLDSIIPPQLGRGNGSPVKMLSCAEYDEVWLAVDCEALARAITTEQVRDLVRCGIRYSGERDCLCMFV